MTILQASLFPVVERFPEQKETIRQLFRKNAAFKNACDDYLSCAKALKHWKQSASGKAPLRIKEYHAMQQELEEELLRHLDEFEKTQIPSRQSR